MSRWIRQELCRRFLESCGEQFNVGTDVWLGNGARVQIGNRSGLGPGCRIYGGVVIGEEVMVAADVAFLSENHRFDDLSRPIGWQGWTESDPPRVEDGAWIGIRATILPGRTVGSGAVVGAGSVVTHDVESLAIVAGNPARVIGSRRQLDGAGDPGTG